MAYKPLNLTLRFLLEISALVAIGYWGFDQHNDIQRFIIGLGGPLIAAILWGVFAVPGDRSRSGNAPIPIPGTLRLAMELSLFGVASWALYDAGSEGLVLILAGLTVIHYVLSYDRVAWLIRQGGAENG